MVSEKIQLDSSINIEITKYSETDSDIVILRYSEIDIQI